MPYGCMHTAFHQELIDSDKLSQYEKIYFTKILDSSANEVELTSALERLSKMLGQAIWEKEWISANNQQESRKAREAFRKRYGRSYL